MKKEYIKPTTIESSVLADEIMLSPFSKIDNTSGSDGEIFKPIDGNPEDDEVGAKPEIPLWEVFQSNVWDD
ncbi:hypothetical protein [Prevotella melaninogenica]|jgi:hypothetical protein|uniref:hypothetical protein n=1 Tax=Prevotella melaninogenica TaxID=28132 RepID=UPI001BA81F38|nr:hypothetical protein [Prevotella melaninogenica]QUB57463.1 hypothetical protein J5A72_08625 [Prevotella melaninogenica]QUB59726.1 hypothetical protein J5A71_08600 [Prevotella melaninogenica]